MYGVPPSKYSNVPFAHILQGFIQHLLLSSKPSGRYVLVAASFRKHLILSFTNSGRRQPCLCQFGIRSPLHPWGDGERPERKERPIPYNHNLSQWGTLTIESRDPPSLAATLRLESEVWMRAPLTTKCVIRWWHFPWPTATPDWPESHKQ